MKKPILIVVLTLLVLVAFFFPKSGDSGGGCVDCQITDCQCLGFEKKWLMVGPVKSTCFGVPYNCETNPADQSAETSALPKGGLEMTPSPNQELPLISIVIAEQSCQPGNQSTKFDILRNGQLVNSLTLPNCLAAESEILRLTSNAVYFSLLPAEVGGDILFGKYTNLYRLNFVDNVGNTLMEQNSLTDIDIATDESQLVYLTGDSLNAKDIIVMNLYSGQLGSFGLPTQAANARFGNFKFSPELDKIALVVGYGPVEEKWEVYILNLSDGTYLLYKESAHKLSIENWVDNNELLLKETVIDYSSL